LEEGRDVLAPFRRLVILHEGMLPDIHYQQWLEAGGHTLLKWCHDQWHRQAGALQGLQRPAPAQRLRHGPPLLEAIQGQVNR
jgi:hypothetical protein